MRPAIAAALPFALAAHLPAVPLDAQEAVTRRFERAADVGTPFAEVGAPFAEVGAPFAPVSAVPALLRTPAGAFAASLIVPGAGQAALGLKRWPIYTALEAGLWVLWADARGDFRDHRDGYRDLAWETARIRSGPRQDGGWSYYETMSHYLSSGAYDTDPAAGLQPEEDPATYNGAVWEVARGIYLPGGVADPGTPEHARALEWYEGRAAGPAFLWSWAGYEGDLTRFRDLIGEADDARRLQTTALGVILANHLVSAVDALIAARLRSPARLELESGLVPASDGLAWRVALRIPLTTANEQPR